MNNEVKKIRRIWFNTMLVLWGVLTVTTGLIIQIYYHIGAYTDAFIGMNHAQWRMTHIYLSIIFLIVAGCHQWIYRKWYFAIFSKRLFHKNKEITVFTVVWIATITTGLIALFFNDYSDKHIWIETHDKLAIILTIMLIFHLFKRRRRLF